MASPQALPEAPSGVRPSQTRSVGQLHLFRRDAVLLHFSFACYYTMCRSNKINKCRCRCRAPSLPPLQGQPRHRLCYTGRPSGGDCTLAPFLDRHISFVIWLFLLLHSFLLHRVLVHSEALLFQNQIHFKNHIHFKITFISKITPISLNSPFPVSLFGV
jgi:hypothetical protein